MWAELVFILGITSGVGQAEAHQEKLLVSQASHLSGIKWDDRYENDQGVFAYGTDREGNLVIVGWVTNPARKWNVEEFTRWYLDERFAQVATAEDLKVWEKRRARLIGGFIASRKSHEPVEFISGTQFISGYQALGQARVKDQPFILKFSNW